MDALARTHTLSLSLSLVPTFSVAFLFRFLLHPPLRSMFFCLKSETTHASRHRRPHR
ncbi:hypothetical protein LX32DRAFT_633582 [Colletotrichum zoysiae]|uniref:Uncharacterized protein n=1 Tax=Colletotrichum zoysiae TaxID=1216348 RepID=A0AAD9HU30_9PEZI|nr:hypothetical protein LX32DRAFT_633582 [Colletotrichum zoysiae]